jgi:hypothetical protein
MPWKPVVLHIDADMSSRTRVSRILNGHYQVFSFHKFSVALVGALKHPPDIIICEQSAGGEFPEDWISHLSTKETTKTLLFSSAVDIPDYVDHLSKLSADLTLLEKLHLLLHPEG